MSQPLLTTNSELPETIRIEPPRGWSALNLVELWRFRELLYFLIWRDVKVRYKQTVLGITWALLQPFLTMLVFTVVFGKVAKLPSHGVPYPILVFAFAESWCLSMVRAIDISDSITRVLLGGLPPLRPAAALSSAFVLAGSPSRPDAWNENEPLEVAHREEQCPIDEHLAAASGER